MTERLIPSGRHGLPLYNAVKLEAAVAFLLLFDSNFTLFVKTPALTQLPQLRE